MKKKKKYIQSTENKSRAIDSIQSCRDKKESSSIGNGSPNFSLFIYLIIFSISWWQFVLNNQRLDPPTTN
jgi:hypothetical protein